MTLDEVIKHAEEVAEENQRVVDTGIVFDDVTIDMLYCDDTEVIEEHLANYQRRAEEHRQIAEWLKDYKRLLEQEPCDDCISRRLAIVTAEQGQVQGYEWLFKQLCDMPSVIPVPKIGQWIPVSERMPEEDETVIASTEYGVYHEAKYTKRYGWEWAYEAGCDYWVGIKEIVTAWMPLPKPYRQQESG